MELVRGRGEYRHHIPVLGFLLLFMVAACTTPIGVYQAGAESTNRTLTGNVLSTGQLSSFTQNVLRLHGLSADTDEDEAAALEELQKAAAQSGFSVDDLFALSEMSFHHGERKDNRERYLAAAVYAYAFLFPEKRSDAVHETFDPKLRWAADLYNRALTAAFASADKSKFEPRQEDVKLPFGSMNVAFDETQLNWHDRRFVDFVPTADLNIRGLRNRYRVAGIGAPLAAGSVPQTTGQTGFKVAPRIKVPVTALLRIENARGALASGTLHGRLELHPQDQGDTVEIEGRQIPLESEPSAALAYSLSNPDIWSIGLRGFLSGSLLQKNESRLVALEPYTPGLIPVVFVHGTASVAARWADMVNDLNGDPLIRNRFQFWFFKYESGNPIPYSALLLRDSLSQAIQQLDPAGQDRALRQMVVIGHSQGGLLAKMVSIDSGSTLWDEISAKPLDSMKLSNETHDLLNRMLFVKPLPFVRRVIFVATPQHGSYLAGWSLSQMAASLVSLPLNIVTGAGELLSLPQDELRFDPSKAGFGSVYGMTPNSPFIRGLSKTRVSPEIPAHSIIAVKGNGPIETGNDGVVSYASAHIEEAQSEFVLRSGHSCQADPRTIAEVRRILLLHASETCAREQVACPMPAAAAE